LHHDRRCAASLSGAQSSKANAKKPESNATMIKQVGPIARPASNVTYQVEVFLNGTEPMIWRRLQLPGSANLGWLHAVLQVAMGWTNSHQHQFICGEHVYADPAAQLSEYEGDPPVLDETKPLLAEILSDIKDGLVYDYDFGDSWEHIVTVEKIAPVGRSRVMSAVCLAGSGACPPARLWRDWRLRRIAQSAEEQKASRTQEHEGMARSSVRS
jgi:hypothetical protein